MSKSELSSPIRLDDASGLPPSVALDLANIIERCLALGGLALPAKAAKLVDEIRVIAENAAEEIREEFNEAA